MIDGLPSYRRTATIAPWELPLPDSAPNLRLSGRSKGGKIETGSAHLFAEDVLLNFSERVARELVNEADLARLFEAGELIATVRDEVFRRNGARQPGNDGGDNPL